MDWPAPPIRKGTLIEFAKNENDVVLQACWHSRMYHSSRMRSSHHFEKYEGVSGCKLFHGTGNDSKAGFPKIPTKNPSHRRNDRQVKFPPVPGANKNLKPSVTHPPGQSNKKNKPMKSSLSMSYSDFQRLIQLQKPNRQYEKISYTKAVHFPNGIKVYGPSSNPEEFYTPRTTKLNPKDYDVYRNPYIQEQLRLQYEKSGGTDSNVLPWLDPHHAEAEKQGPAEPETLLGQDTTPGADHVDTLLGDARLQDEPPETQNVPPSDGVNGEQVDTNNIGDTDQRQEEQDGGYESDAGANETLDPDKNDTLSVGNRSDNAIDDGTAQTPVATDNQIDNDGQDALESADAGTHDTQGVEAAAEILEEHGDVDNEMGETSAPAPDSEVGAVLEEAGQDGLEMSGEAVQEMSGEAAQDEQDMSGEAAQEMSGEAPQEGQERSEEVAQVGPESHEDTGDAPNEPENSGLIGDEALDDAVGEAVEGALLAASQEGDTEQNEEDGSGDGAEDSGEAGGGDTNGEDAKQ